MYIDTKGSFNLCLNGRLIGNNLLYQFSYTREENIMKKHYFYIIILLVGSIVSPTAGYASEIKDQDNKVILVSFDGMRNDLTKEYVKDGNLPHIKSLMKNGVAAKDSKTVTPSLTAPSHAAIATGATPSETGMVSN
jgi:predicted AlkP superfamily pyrophosphatase or phosphodiesterase